MLEGAMLFAALKLAVAIGCSFKVGPWARRLAASRGLSGLAVVIVSMVILAWASVVVAPPDASAFRAFVLFICLVAGASVAWVRGGWRVVLGLAVWALAAQFGLIVAPGSVISDMVAAWIAAAFILVLVGLAKRAAGIDKPDL